jgi:anaerobic selenocysteine-containing dehydrogenase
VYAPERVLTPLVRVGRKGDGRFREASWDEALDLVADRIGTAIAERGPAAVVPYLYNSSAGALAAGGLTPAVFERLGCPEVLHTICASTAKAAWQRTYGEMLPADPLDLVHARLVVVWGANPTVSNTHLLPLLTEARRAGARLVVVDPRATGVARRADLHVPVLPGTDVALAYGLARRLAELGAVDRAFGERWVEGQHEFLAAAAAWPLERVAEVCDVPAADLDAMAHLVASTRPAMLRLGWGLERNRNGGSGVAAVLSLWALAGHFGERGSGVLTSTGRGSPVRPYRLAPDGAGASVDPPRAGLDMNDVGRLLCGELAGHRPPAVLFVQGANPAATAIDQVAMLRGLAGEGTFTVVHDQVLTDTARFADVVLPAPTHFEVSGVHHGYGGYHLQRWDAVIDRVGECRSNDEVAAGLALRLGLPASEVDPDPERLARAMLDGASFGPTRPEGTVQFVHTFPDGADGSGRRVRLHDPDGPLPLPAYRPAASPFPVVVISPAGPRTVNSIFGERATPVAAVHPTDAARAGLRSGGRVRLRNDLASVEMPWEPDPDLRPGVVAVPKGAWLGGGLTVNALVPDHRTDLGSGACFNDARVVLEAV